MEASATDSSRKAKALDRFLWSLTGWLIENLPRYRKANCPACLHRCDDDCDHIIVDRPMHLCQLYGIINRQNVREAIFYYLPVLRIDAPKIVENFLDLCRLDGENPTLALEEAARLMAELDVKKTPFRNRNMFQRLAEMLESRRREQVAFL